MNHLGLLRIAAGLAMLFMASSIAGCWPGRCGGALRGTPQVTFTGDHSPCTEGPSCAESIPATQGFHQNADYQRVEELAVLLEESGLARTSWFLIDEHDAVVPSSIEAVQYDSAHSCASAVGFALQPDAPLEPGVYRLVVLVERVHWPLLRGPVTLSSFAGEPAIVQFYRVD